MNLFFLNKDFFKKSISHELDGSPCIVDERNWIDKIFLESSMSMSLNILNIRDI